MPQWLISARARSIALHTALAATPSFALAHGIILDQESHDIPLLIVGLIAALGISFVLVVLELFVRLAINTPVRIHPIGAVLPATVLAIIPAMMIAEPLGLRVSTADRHALASGLCLLFALALGGVLSHWYVPRGQKQEG